MRKRHVLAAAMVVCGSMVLAMAQVEPATQPSAQDKLDQMLKSTGDNVRPLQPMETGPTADTTSGGHAVAPNAPQVNLLREGSYIVDRVGRLSKTSDGLGWEFRFESDGKALRDPPVLVLPNLKLMLMEDQLKQTRKDLKFRVTGMLTEYRGRNYVLLEKVVVVGD